MTKVWRSMTSNTAPNFNSTLKVVNNSQQTVLIALPNLLVSYAEKVNNEFLVILNYVGHKNRLETSSKKESRTMFC